MGEGRQEKGERGSLSMKSVLSLQPSNRVCPVAMIRDRRFSHLRCAWCELNYYTSIQRYIDTEIHRYNHITSHLHYSEWPYITVQYNAWQNGTARYNNLHRFTTDYILSHFVFRHITLPYLTLPHVHTKKCMQHTVYTIHTHASPCTWVTINRCV